MWKIGKGPDLALSVTPPRATWKKDEYRNYAIMISQFHDKAIFTRLHAAWKEAEGARKKTKTMQGRSREKGQLLLDAKRGKEEFRHCLNARLVTLLGPAATEKQLSLTVNSIRCYEGKFKEAQILRADVTLLMETGQKLRKTSGQEGIHVDYCGYDEAARKLERDTERWVPLPAKPEPHTRAQALAELSGVGQSEHMGLHLNFDGVGYKMRFPKNSEDEAWKKVHDTLPPADKKFFIERVPATIPNEAVVRELKETLHWDVVRPSCRMRGKGINARKTVIVWSRSSPASDTVDLDGTVVTIREQIILATKPISLDKRANFFGDFDQQKAADYIIGAGGKKSDFMDSAKPFAYQVIEKREKGATAAPSATGRVWVSSSTASMPSQPVVPAAITEAVKDSFTRRMDEQQAAQQAAMVQFQAKMAEEFQAMMAAQQAAQKAAFANFQKQMTSMREVIMREKEGLQATDIPVEFRSVRQRKEDEDESMGQR